MVSSINIHTPIHTYTRDSQKTMPSNHFSQLISNSCKICTDYSLDRSKKYWVGCAISYKLLLLQQRARGESCDRISCLRVSLYLYISKRSSASVWRHFCWLEAHINSGCQGGHKRADHVLRLILRPQSELRFRLGRTGQVHHWWKSFLFKDKT